MGGSARGGVEIWLGSSGLGTEMDNDAAAARLTTADSAATLSGSPIRH